MAGLDSTGLTILRQPEIIEDIVLAEQQEIHPNINTADDEVLGQLNSIMSSSLTELWEGLLAVHDAFNIAKAEGKNLDDLAALRNVTRQDASKSATSDQQFIGANGTTIPAGTLLQNPVTLDRFLTTSSVSLDSNGCLSLTLSVGQVLNSTSYTISVNGVTYTYVSDIDATANEIVTDFDTQITNDTNITWSSSLDGDTLTITSDDNNLLTIIPINYFTVDSVTRNGSIEAEETGPVVAPAGSVTKVVSSIAGLTSTTNLSQLILGRDIETDAELRIRVQESTGSDCTGTIPSIEGAITGNVAGVTSALVTENTTAVTDGDGRPPHSYEVVVVGGDNDDVAQEIWRTKPAGIQLYGNTNVVIVDSNGNNRSINFTRPTVVNFAVQVSYTTYSEETFPVGGQDTIKQAVVDHVSGLGIDQDVITKRFFGPIYSAVEGIDDLVVEIQVITNAGDPPVGGSWQTATIPVSPSQFAGTTLVDVTVLDVT